MQTFSGLSPSGYNSSTNVVWLEQPLHKVFKPKIPPEKTPFLAKNLSIFFSVRMFAISGFFGMFGMSLNESIYRLNGPHEIITQINLIN